VAIRKLAEKAHFFDEFGALVAERWAAKNFDAANFAKVALGALQELPPSEHVDASEIVEWVMSADRPPPQDLKSHFGQPPLILYRGDLFYIEALFWLDVHTDIHQHGFSGAFHLLEGSSLHCRYVFELNERINARFLLGELRLKSVEYLRKGDSRPIESGHRFIHSTFHLHRPTISIVVRTPFDSEAGPQYSYLKPFVAHDGTRRRLMTRRIELLEALHEIGNPDYRRYINKLVAQPDFETAFFVLEQSHRRLPSDDFLKLLERAREQHGQRTELLLPVFQEMRRAEEIRGRCKFITDPEHRLLLALLLGLPDRASIFKFIRRQYDGDPVEIIVKWVEQMASTKAEGSEESNALGIRFDDASFLVLKSLLRGLSFSAVKERLKREYDQEDVESQEAALRKLFSAFQNSLLFEPLFAGNEVSTGEITGRRRTTG
jgi:hypothetical protein